jgi:SAM-dependent methyltransferase
VKEAQYRAQAELEDGHWWHRGKTRVVREVLRRAVPAGSVVADVGCGTGATLAALSPEYRCVGADPSAEAIALARARFPAVTFLAGDVPGALGEWHGRADAVLLLDVLEHAREDRDLLARVVAGARPGAHLLLTVPADMALWSAHDESLGHFRRYDRAGLAALWRGLPVTERLLSYYNARLYPLARAARAWSRLRGRAWGRAGTDVGRVPGPANRLMEAVFAGESARLTAAFDGGGRGYARGVSLIALLRREP